MKIRLAGPSDLETLPVLVVGFREVLRRTYPDDETLRENLKKLLVDGDDEYFLAFDGGKGAMGYIQQRYRYSVWLSTLEATLEDLYVSTGSRRQGAELTLSNLQLIVLERRVVARSRWIPMNETGAR